jgi:imidazolonepropionase-like amidohydrolase
MKAIQSATREAARLLKIDSRLGTLEEQKVADVVAVEGNPLDDIRSMRRVVFVMKDGVVVKNP